MSGIVYVEVPDFYAAVERAEHPELRARPVIVGGNPRKRGLVQSASADARAAGVDLGTPVAEALQRCPTARALRTDMKRYREASERLRVCLAGAVGGLESAGLGAFYFQLEGAPAGPLELARRLRDRVEEKLGLELVVGIAAVKFLARLAAEESTEGIHAISSGDEAQFLAPLCVARLPGVGPKTASCLADELGIRRVGELLTVEPQRIEETLGNHGLRILEYARGRDDSLLRAAPHSRSFSMVSTLSSPSVDLEVLWQALEELARPLQERLERHGLRAACVTLRIHFADAVTESRSRTLGRSIASAESINDIGRTLLERTHAGSRPVRRVGLALSKLAPRDAIQRQLELFSDSQ